MTKYAKRTVTAFTQELGDWSNDVESEARHPGESTDYVRGLREAAKMLAERLSSAGLMEYDEISR